MFITSQTRSHARHSIRPISIARHSGLTGQQRLWLAAGLVVSTILLGACQKTETIPTTADRLKSVQQIQQTNPDFYVPRKTVDYMKDLKDLKDAPAKPEPAPARAAPDSRAAQVAAATPAATQPTQPTQPAPAPPPVRAAEPAPAPVTPPVQVATAAPTARPAAPKAEPAAPSMLATPVSREQPEFPRDAVRQGVESGLVRAKLTINASGDVTNVAILQARPSRIFDRAVTNSLSRWKFNPGAEGRSFDTEIAFQR
jgi:TonB family protein